MPSRGRSNLLILCALLAGCGQQSADDAASGAPVADARVAKAVESCGVSTGVAPAGDVVPRELRPAPAQVAAASRSDAGYEARVIYARPLREVMSSIVARAGAAGHEVTFKEYEGSDGELTLERDGTTTTMRLLAVRRCPSVSQAAITATGS